MLGSLHPAIVHIPIGLLTLYAVLEILPLRRFFPADSLRLTKGILLVAGLLGAFFALQSGEAAGERSMEGYRLFETHAFFAGAMTWIFAALAVLYIVAWLRPVMAPVVSGKQNTLVLLWNTILRVSTTLDKDSIRRVVAFVGFIFLSFTGALGGALVYGTQADPLISFVTRLLGVS